MTETKHQRAVIPAAIDRRADVLPFNTRGKTADRVVADPYSDTGAKIVVTSTFRDDPLGRLYSRKQVSESQYAAGRFLQEQFELAEVGALKAMDPGKEPVDGGGVALDPIGDKQRKAANNIIRARHALGGAGFDLASDVLARRMFIEQCTKARGLRGERAQRYYANRFREILDELAEAFGYAGTAPAARKPRDKYSEAAKHAGNPELHAAIARAKEAA